MIKNINVVDYNQNNSESLESSNITIFDCFFNSLSSEIIAAFNVKAKARKSISFVCLGNKAIASGKLISYLDSGINLTTLFNFCSNSSYSLDPEKSGFNPPCFNSEIKNSDFSVYQELKKRSAALAVEFFTK